MGLLDLETASALNRLDYRSLSETSDSYLSWRARMILGLFDRDRDATGLNTCETLSEIEKTLLLFFDRVTRELIDPSDIETFRSIDIHDCDPYLRAEHNFIIAYAFICRADFQTSIAYSKMGFDIYMSSDLYGPASIALFNLCVAYNHLNYQDLYSEALAQLQALHEQYHDLPKLGLYRLEMYKLIDSEDYTNALTKCEALIDLYIDHDRFRDLGELRCFESYLRIKLCLPIDEIESKGFALAQRAALQQYHQLSASGFDSLSFTSESLVSWQDQGINAIDQLLLLEVVCEKLHRLGDSESLLKLARAGKRIAAQTQQSFNLVDFRFYEGAALISLGDVRLGRASLNASRAAATEEKVDAKIRKIDRILSIHKLKPSSEPPQDSDHSVVLDWQSRVIEVDGKTIELRRRPVTFSLLYHLCKTATPLALPDLYKMVYEQEYRPFLHFERINSLINRTRRTVGKKDIIIRTNKHLELNTKYTRIVRNEPGKERASVQRRQRLIQILKHFPDGVTATDLSEQFECSLRTLQLDLAHLAEENVVTMLGRTRTRRYKLSMMEKAK